MGRLPVVGVTVLCALSVLVWATAHIVPFITAEDQQTAVKTSSPAEGYTVHGWHHIWWTDTKWVLITTIARCWHLIP